MITFISAENTEWLLNSNPWTKYKTLTEILEKSDDDQEVLTARQQLIQHPLVQELIQQTSDWFPESITRHNDPKISHYKLRMLTDFGLTFHDNHVSEIIAKVSEHYNNHLFMIRQDLPTKNFTKHDKTSNNWHALPCDTPLLTYSILKLGLINERINKSVEEIKIKWNTNNSWFCHFFFVEGQYKKLQIGCPMAGLQALEVFSSIPELKESVYAKNAFAPIKFHYESGKSLYYFGRSKKFWTLKYPFIWYNALYMAEVLSRFEFIKKEKLMIDLIQWLENSQTKDGKYKATSIFLPYKQWDFGNKKDASPWITFLVYFILKKWYSK